MVSFKWGQFCPPLSKKGTYAARGVTSVSLDGTIGRKGVNCKFLELYGLQLTQLKHWYQNCKLVSTLGE
jgi:hypothetical protein